MFSLGKLIYQAYCQKPREKSPHIQECLVTPNVRRTVLDFRVPNMYIYHRDQNLLKLSLQCLKPFLFSERYLGDQSLELASNSHLKLIHTVTNRKLSCIQVK